jgi:hypothetical protein
MNNSHLDLECHGNQKPPSRSTGRRVSYKDDECTPCLLKSCSFNESVTVFPIIERASEMSDAERNMLYYSTCDMQMFRLEAKQTCVRVVKQARNNASMVNPNMTTGKHVSAVLSTDSSLRGLEKFLCPERNFNKSVVMSQVLQYSEHLTKSSLPLSVRYECLAEAYTKLSNWSLMKALETGRTDFLEAYDREEDGKASTTFAQSKTPIEIEPFPKLTRKRKR